MYLRNLCRATLTKTERRLTPQNPKYRFPKYSTDMVIVANGKIKFLFECPFRFMDRMAIHGWNIPMYEPYWLVEMQQYWAAPVINAINIHMGAVIKNGKSTRLNHTIGWTPFWFLIYIECYEQANRLYLVVSFAMDGDDAICSYFHY